MTDLEKLEECIGSLDTAISATSSAMSMDRKMSHTKHTNGHFTKALTELASIRTQFLNLKVRIKAVGP